MSAFPVSADASILFFPDAIVSRAIDPTLALLQRLGLEPVAATAFELDWDIMSEVRRYVPKPTTRQAIKMRNLIETAGPSLYVLLAASSSDRRDCAERLNKAKGSAFPWMREDHHIRSVLASPHPMLKLFHTPDNDAQLRFEMGVYTRHRPEAFAIMRRDAEGMRAIAQEILDRTPLHDLNFNTALARFVTALEASPGGAELVRRTRLHAQSPRLETGEVFDWSELVELADREHCAIDRRDLLVVCAHLTLVTE
jgi:hypothetical protein